VSNSKVRTILEFFLIAIVLAIVFGACVVSTNSSRAQIADVVQQHIIACEQANVLRAEFTETNAGLEEFLMAAAEARQRSADNPDATPAQRETDLEAAEQYLAIAGRLDQISQVDCDALFGGT
jgi:hypothetical protein